MCVEARCDHGGRGERKEPKEGEFNKLVLTRKRKLESPEMIACFAQGSPQSHSSTELCGFPSSTSSRAGTAGRLGGGEQGRQMLGSDLTPIIHLGSVRGEFFFKYLSESTRFLEYWLQAFSTLINQCQSHGFHFSGFLILWNISPIIKIARGGAGLVVEPRALCMLAKH